MIARVAYRGTTLGANFRLFHSGRSGSSLFCAHYEGGADGGDACKNRNGPNIEATGEKSPKESKEAKELFNHLFLP